MEFGRNKKIIEESVKFKLQHVACNLRHRTDIAFLKVKQIKALKAAAKGDVLGVMATGFGKTFIMQCLPYLVQPGNPDSCLCCPSPIIIISPLDAILAEQKEKLGSAAMMVKDFKQYNESVSFILGHPEHFIGEGSEEVQAWLKGFDGIERPKVFV